ncbi:MAG: DUF4956 domain-containing protein [Saprospiraceae bacterium]|nr:DUF4956 domain-containing protein [Saprospiraceae bacterium]MCB0626672.1 DUF4956 domain-containing protein [Saprospiraceae bacterium]MCB0682766.1 DUF4956 domain-containing protein [Saprospiraceae bacterium]
MDLLQKIQEKYIAEFSNNVPFDEFLFNLLVTAVLAVLLRWFYIRYGLAVSNRRRFGNNFLPLALGTLLIIMIVKSSIALSLGLVGALSIVRFRAAIKDPEELTFLFIAIGLGLAGGANQPILGAVAFVAIMILLYLHRLATRRPSFRQEDRMYVNISTDTNDLNRISSILTTHFPYVELKRLDTLQPGLELAFICRAESLDQIDRCRQELTQLSPATRLSIVDQPDLIV